MISKALALAALGWHVFPTRRRKPAVKEWPDRATIEPVQLREWWGRWPDADPAIHCGASGLVVLDIDGKPGWTSMAALEERHGGPLPPTLKVRTGRPLGEHWYYRRPDRPCGNGAAIHGLEGLDVRGDRGFVFAPGALHRDHAGETTGATYTLVVRPECPLGVLKDLVAFLPLAPDCICLDGSEAPARHDDTPADLFEVT